MNIRQLFNGFGLKSLQKPISIPNTQLAIDTGEDLKPQVMKVEYQNQKQFVVLTHPTKYEHAQIIGQSKPIDPANLQKDFWFGDPRGNM